MLMKVILFDIDGTLMLTGGAGKRGMTRAFEAVFQVKNALEGLKLSGMTDRKIFRNACDKAGVECTEAAEQRFKELYTRFLQEEIRHPNPEKKLMPGIPGLLDDLRSQPGVHLGLLTGNYQQTAKIKLAAFGLDAYFEFGAFGDDDEDRNRLLPFALQRLAAQIGKALNGAAIWVIGDTPQDVECARPHGAKALAVATGGYSEAILAKARPDMLLPNLQNRQEVLEKILMDSAV